MLHIHKGTSASQSRKDLVLANSVIKEIVSINEIRKKIVRQKVRQNVQDHKNNLSAQRAQNRAFLRPPHTLAARAHTSIPNSEEAVTSKSEKKNSKRRGMLYKGGQHHQDSSRSFTEKEEDVGPNRRLKPLNPLQLQQQQQEEALRRQGSKLLALAE